MIFFCQIFTACLPKFSLFGKERGVAFFFFSGRFAALLDGCRSSPFFTKKKKKKREREKKRKKKKRMDDEMKV